MYAVDTLKVMEKKDKNNKYQVNNNPNNGSKLNT